MKSILITTASSMLLALVASVAASPVAAADPEPPADTEAQLPTRRVDQLKGDKVMNDKNEEIGSVSSIVRRKSDNALYAIVGVGGFLGIGEHDVAIPLAEMQLRGDRLLAPAGTTKDQLKNMPEYKEGDYVKLADSEVVSVGSHTGGGGGSH